MEAALDLVPRASNLRWVALDLAMLQNRLGNLSRQQHELEAVSRQYPHDPLLMVTVTYLLGECFEHK
jgi:hypothetical protein